MKFKPAQGQIIKANNLDIWYETFGNKEDPALLLLMGGCCQGILWPTEFCEQLAQAGFYVIRYDHRDAGFSTCFDYDKTPYTHLDMAKDAIGLLDALHIKQAHLFGLSTGGAIAILMAAQFPERISSLAVMATSCDFRPMNLALNLLPKEEGSLSTPKEYYLTWMRTFLEKHPQNDEEKLEQRMEGWRMLNGPIAPFEEELYRDIHQEFLSRLRHTPGLKNHILANMNSEDTVRSSPSGVNTRTLILLGSVDPILPPDHGEALAKAIPSSKYILVEGLGHVPNCKFYDLMVDEIKKNALL